MAISFVVIDFVKESDVTIEALCDDESGEFASVTAFEELLETQRNELQLQRDNDRGELVEKLLSREFFLGLGLIDVDGNADEERGGR